MAMMITIVATIMYKSSGADVVVVSVVEAAAVTPMAVSADELP